MLMALPADQRDAMSLVARLFLNYGFPEKAARLFKALTLLEPDVAAHHRALALALFRSQRSQEALSALDKLALLGQIDEGFHMLRAQVLSDLGQSDEAASAMQAFLALRKPQRVAAGARA